MAQRLKRSFRCSSLSIGVTEYIGNLSHGVDYSLNSTLASGAVWAPAHSTLLNDHVTITSARYSARTKLIAIRVGRIVRKRFCIVKSPGAIVIRTRVHDTSLSETSPWRELAISFNGVARFATKIKIDIRPVSTTCGSGWVNDQQVKIPIDFQSR